MEATPILSPLAVAKAPSTGMLNRPTLIPTEPKRERLVGDRRTDSDSVTLLPPDAVPGLKKYQRRRPMLKGITSWKTTILGVMTGTLAILAGFGVSPIVSDGTIETIATVLAVAASGVLVFIKPAKKDADRS